MSNNLKRKLAKTKLPVCKGEAVPSANKKIAHLEKTVEASKNINLSTNPTSKITQDFVFNHLLTKDRKLNDIIAKVTSPCFLFQEPQKIFNGSQFTFEHLSKTIIYQQLAGSAAQAIYSRFLKLYHNSDLVFPTPQQIMSTPSSELREIGLSMRKISYLVDLSRHYKDELLSDKILLNASDEIVSDLLIKVKGIGPWTIDMFLMNCLKRLDVLPLGDLGVKKGMVKHFGITPTKDKQVISEEKMLELSNPWKPYRSAGAWLMWELMSNKD